MAKKAQTVADPGREGSPAPWGWQSLEQEAEEGKLSVRGFICEGQFSQHPTKLVLLSHFTEVKTEP